MLLAASVAALQYRRQQSASQQGVEVERVETATSGEISVTERIQEATSEALHVAFTRCQRPTAEENDDAPLQRNKRNKMSIHNTNINDGLEMMLPGIVFRRDVRNEWINAVFGRAFFETTNYQPPRQGVGLSEIPSYVTYQAVIPANAVDTGDKVGVTLSRIAIGLYVRQVEPGSEAYCAGVKEGSVLLSMNGMGMLGEPSRNALERLWQYEGHFEEPEDASVSSNSQVSSSTNSDKENGQVGGEVKGFLALTFIEDGFIYTCMFVSNPPFGISWAPCGNFALVQRAHSFAAANGVRRGCLVAAVNGRSLREMDHEQTAAEIRDLFVNGKEIQLTLCYTPAASRTGFFERNQQSENSKRITSPGKREEVRTLASADGVEVRVHPLEYSLAGLFTCGAKLDGVEPRGRRRSEGSVAALASKVAAGEVEAPSGMSRHRSYRSSNASVSTGSIHAPKVRVYGPCPAIPANKLLVQWDPLSALVFCLRCHQANFDHDTLVQLMSGNASEDPLEVLKKIMQTDDSWKIAQAFLLQWISMLCSVGGDEQEEKSFSKELASVLLSLSRRHEEFSQQLYFVLRSYTAVLEGYRQSSKNEDSNRNLLTLLQALDRLRSAQRQLSSQLTGESHIVAESDAPALTNGHSQDSDMSGLANTTVGSASSTSASPSTSKQSSRSGKSRSSETVPKKKSITKLFRKKGKKLEKSPKKVTSPKRLASSRKSLSSRNGKMTSKLVSTPPSSLNDLTVQLEYLSVSTLLENMTCFLAELDRICDDIERSMLKSFSQKVADWALQPWSASKRNALATVTDSMREGLQKAVGGKSANRLPLANPVESSEVLVALDTDECYLLPSAHFPLLLTFNVKEKLDSSKSSQQTFLGQEQLYRTSVELVAVRASAPPVKGSRSPETASLSSDLTYVVQGAIAGVIKDSGRSLPMDHKSEAHSWEQRSTLTFDTRSSWGAPQTLSLRLSSIAVGENGRDQLAHTDESGRLVYASEVGYCWVDLKPMWERVSTSMPSNGKKPRFATVTCHAQVWSLEGSKTFDEHGDLIGGLFPVSQRLELDLRITTETLKFNDAIRGSHPQRRMLLYKHDDDLRQEMFAIQFIETCDKLLKASGFDLQLLTFRCIPVGEKRGFIEWVPGSIPLSEICKPFAGSIIAGKDDAGLESNNVEESTLSEVSRAGLDKYQSLSQHLNTKQKRNEKNELANNPIQDFLRSVAYDRDAPYLIRKEVMDSYVKSCAGYCVLTYLLGVGDRHLDNLLLHQSGRFFHCDFSFILGNDPKKYLPMRITEDMVSGMGGRESDNYHMFLSLAGAAFIALRRHENVRVILSLVRLMAPSALPDVSVNQNPDEVLLAMRDRLRLDLADDQAIIYMEKLIEKSISSKMWLAVDAMHTLAKRF